MTITQGRSRLPAERSEPAPGARPELAQGVPPEIDDVLVFEHSDTGFALVGGRGRGAGWAGAVQLDADDDSFLGRAWRIGQTIRCDNRRPRQIVGPYHARHAAAVPVGQSHIVVFGSRRPIKLLDSDLLREAAAAVDQAAGVPAEKLLADELELVDAIRTLMAYRPTNVRDTARHVAAVAARSLACEVAAIRIEHSGQTVLEGVGFGVGKPVPGPQADAVLSDAAQTTHPAVEQASLAGVGLFGIDVASRMMLPVSSGPMHGAFAVGHSADAPRGFTSLCQRIGRAIADSAETLLAQAVVREELDAQVDLLSRVIGTDALTGLANRRKWDEAVADLKESAEARPSVVIVCDVDDLKDINDKYGHRAGDAVLVSAANLMTSSVRQGDLVARIGGDEFGLLLRGADIATAERIARRIRRAERLWRVPDSPVGLRLSIGIAAVADRDVEAARSLADQKMYANKRRRMAAARRSAGQPAPGRRSDDAQAASAAPPSASS